MFFTGLLGMVIAVIIIAWWGPKLEAEWIR